MEENEITQRIIDIDLDRNVRQSFIDYAMSVIVARALPDVRDGLKPVHRRILYAMMELGLDHDKPHRKSARIVGDTMGKYHPHGDSSIYDAMVRLAQPFSTRNPLVDGHGNFGSIDGDGAAAMRYTEARMTPLAEEMLRDLKMDTVDMTSNFDETLKEPTVLPAAFPNLLVNGAQGIAVGMATNIPTHNLGETIDATIAVMDKPDITTPELMEIMPGPDFPTGGIVCGRGGIVNYFETGKGKIVTRSRYHTETSKSGKVSIIVTEIPYMVNKAQLLTKIADLVKEKRVEGISDLRDESDREGMRIVIELKKDVDADALMNQLFKYTQLQDSFGVNMLALDHGVPKTMGVKAILRAYVEHRMEVLIRKTQFQLKKAEARAHILEGLLKALDFIDEVINIIRSSKTVPEARERLMERFGFSELQANAILEMRLQTLTGLQRENLQKEYDELKQTIAYYHRILAEEGLRMEIIKTDLLEVKRRYADPRRTEIQAAEADILDIKAFIPEHDVIVTVTGNNYVKRVPLREYSVQHRGGRGLTGLHTGENDYVRYMFATSSHSELMVFTDAGKAYLLDTLLIPEAKRNAKGTALVNMLRLRASAGDRPGEKVQTIIPRDASLLGDYEVEDMSLIFITKKGLIKRCRMSEFENINKAGLMAIKLREDDELINVLPLQPGQELIVATRFGRALHFIPDDNVRAMGRTASGVKAVKLAEDDEVVSATVVNPEDTVLTVTESGYGKRTPVSEYPIKHRGGLGVRAINPKYNEMLAGIQNVAADMDAVIISSDGIIIRIDTEDIRLCGRYSRGVKLMRIGENGKLVALSIVSKASDSDTEVTKPLESEPEVEEELPVEEADDADDGAVEAEEE